MNDTRRGQLDGIHDILPQPFIQETALLDASIIIMTIVFFLIVLLVVARYHILTKTKQRTQFRKTVSRINTISSTELANELLALLKESLKTSQLENREQLAVPASISNDEWRHAIQQLYLARYSKEKNTELSTAVEVVRKILWCSKK